MKRTAVVTIGIVVSAIALSGCRGVSQLGANLGAHRPLTVPAGWISQPPPADTSGWMCANWAPEHWHVDTTATGDLRISSGSGWSTPLYRTTGGFLQGINRGEFGGELEWLDSSGSKPRMTVVLHQANPIVFTPTSAGIFLWDGLAHLGGRRGSLLRLTRGDAGEWHVDSVLSLPSSPEAVAIVDSSHFIVASPEGIFGVDSHARTATWLYRNDQWALTYPTSILVAPTGTIYVGMRRAVAQLDSTLGGYHEVWLVPSTCPRHVRGIDGMPCACAKGAT